MKNSNWQIIEPPPKSVCCVLAFQKDKKLSEKAEFECPECGVKYKRQPDGKWKAAEEAK